MMALFIALGLMAVVVVATGLWCERKEVRMRVIREQQRRIHADAVRMKAVLDQEAFRAARAMHEAAQRSRRESRQP